MEKQRTTQTFPVSLTLLEEIISRDKLVFEDRAAVKSQTLRPGLNCAWKRERTRVSLVCFARSFYTGKAIRWAYRICLKKTKDALVRSRFYAQCRSGLTPQGFTYFRHSLFCKYDALHKRYFLAFILTKSSWKQSKMTHSCELRLILNW